MLPFPPALASHNQQALTRHNHINLPASLPRLPSLSTTHGTIKGLRQLEEPNRTSGQQAKTDDRLSEVEVLGMSRDAQIVGVFVDDAVLRSLSVDKDVRIHHSLDEPPKLAGHGWRLQYFRLCFGWDVKFSRHEAVCASEVHGAAAEICAPFTF